ncbi:MAG: hypothetical protein BGO98_08280 [Myxococcales bacterium 68-20]|nr:hypothetical protein [Myxococcales bacterium]OJY24997.1 MAG: hypothetical protein BGO98_08280 [Myxococcales bacterium 68-20]
MLLTASVTKAELVALIDGLTPMRVEIDEHRGRSITLGRPEVSLVAGRGLRLRGDGRVVWDVAGVAIPVTVQVWQVLLVPRVLSRGRSHLLSLEPVIEELDLKLVPGFLDWKIADAIREAIAQHREKIAWDFARTLSKRLPLSARIDPASLFEIVATDGEVEVGTNELRFGVRFEARIERRAGAPVPESEQEPRSAPVGSARAVAR